MSGHSGNIIKGGYKVYISTAFWPKTKICDDDLLTLFKDRPKEVIIRKCQFAYIHKSKAICVKQLYI
jgi:hypothetical protein